MEIREQGGAGRMVYLVCNTPLPIEHTSVITNQDHDIYCSHNMVSENVKIS